MHTSKLELEMFLTQNIFSLTEPCLGFKGEAATVLKNIHEDVRRYQRHEEACNFVSSFCLPNIKG